MPCSRPTSRPARRNTTPPRPTPASSGSSPTLPRGAQQSARAAVGLAGWNACAPFLVGTVAPGGACIVSTECADSGLCQPTEPTCAQQCCPGTCIAPAAPIPVGGDCSTPQPNQSCATGSFCLRATSGAPLTCVVPGMTAEGGACSGCLRVRVAAVLRPGRRDWDGNVPAPGRVRRCVQQQCPRLRRLRRYPRRLRCDDR